MSVVMKFAGSAVPEEVGRIPPELLDRIENTNEEISHRVAQVQTMTEAGTLAAGDCLAQIVTNARGYVERLHQRLAGQGDSGSARQVEAAMARQTQSTSAFSRDISESIDRQVESARRAQTYLSDILTTAEGVGKLTQASKLLAINAMIQASRMEDGGEAFAVIAHEMSVLSEQISETNRLIKGLANSLEEVLPTLTTEAENMSARAGTFSEELQGHLNSVSDATHQLAGTVTWASETGNAQVVDLLTLSQAALSHLQFQDPVSQILGRVLHDMDELRRDAKLVAAGQPLRMTLVSEDVVDEEHIDVGEAENPGELLLF